MFSWDVGNSVDGNVRCGAVLSRSVMSDSLRPYGLQSARLLCPWGFSRQEYWRGLPCPPPGDLPSPGIKPRSFALQVDSLPTEPPGKPLLGHWYKAFDLGGVNRKISSILEGGAESLRITHTSELGTQCRQNTESLLEQRLLPLSIPLHIHAQTGQKYKVTNTYGKFLGKLQECGYLL